MGEQFGLALDEIGEMLFQRRRDARVQFLPSPAQQGRVGSVLHQRVLEQVGGMRSDAAAKQQSRIAELIQRGLQLLLRTLRHRLDQFIGKLAAEHRADLRNLLGGRPEPVEASHQRGMQGRRHRQRRKRCRRQHRGNPVSLRGAFQHRLGQLLDKQRHAVGALDDLRDDIGGERGIAGQLLHQRLAVAFAEPIERQTRDVGAAAPGRLEFGTKGDHQQHRQLPHPVDGQIQELARGRIDPVGVLEYHQHRPVPRLGFELAEQRLEQLLPFALRAEVEVRGGTRQRQQLAQQRDIVVIPRARREQRPQFAELGFDRVVAGEPGGAFELRR